MRAISLCSMLIVIVGCQRDLPYEAPAETPISGYQLEGYVTDHFGVPLKGVGVQLWYDYEFVDTLHSPNPVFYVDDPAQIARVEVLSRNKRIINVLYDGHSNVGLLDTEWDKRDAFGRPVPSGVYTVDFSMNGVSRSSYTVMVDGAVTAVTDSLGHYLIPDENLPVDFYPVPRSDGNYRITSLVSIQLTLEIPRGTSLTLTKDQVTRFDFTI